MKNHVSVRCFTSQTIDALLLEQILSCGQTASSSSFVQAYSVIRVVDQDRRATIAEAAGNQQWIIEAAEFLVFCADMQRIQHCCQKEGQGDLQGNTEHFITATVDVALMAQNVMLAAESAGLGGVFIGGIRNDPRMVSECLQIPEHVYPVFGMCLGWPQKRGQHKPRLPLKVVLHQDQYEPRDIQQQVHEYDRNMAAYYSERGMNAKNTNWSTQTALAVQGKKREHMQAFLQQRGFLLR
jgi:nitroreductase